MPAQLNKELYELLVYFTNYKLTSQFSEYADKLKAMKANPDFSKLSVNIRELIDELLTQKETLPELTVKTDDLRVEIDEQIHFFASSK